MIDLKLIQESSIYIKCYSLKRFRDELIYEEYFEELLIRVGKVLSQWSGNTYVGQRKEDNEMEIFQDFFESLSKLIELLEENKNKLFKLEKQFLFSIKYNGIVYRYLGYGSSINKNRHKKIIPEYNNIFVSWSKNSKNSYLESKLYGIKTKIILEIPDRAFGIDIEGFQEFINEELDCNFYISRGEEREVVFPTIEEYVIEVKYERS